MPKEISQHKNYFDTTIRNAKTGNRTENRTRTNRKILCANEPACQEKFTYIKKYSMRPSEVQKPETGQKTGTRTNQKFLCINRYVNTNLHALEFF